MNVDHLDCLFQEYGYDVKERTASYRVYLLNQGMYHGAEIQIMDDDIDATPILDRYSKLGYHAKQQRFKSIEQAESYLFKGFFNTQTTANDINRRYTEFAAVIVVLSTSISVCHILYIVKVRKILLVELQISFLQLKKQSIERGHIL